MKKIVVVSLFDGLSGCRIVFDRIEHLEVARYYSSEVDKYAMQVANHNYPQDEQYRLGDITKVDGRKLIKEIREEFGDIDVVLVGGSPCFVKGTKIITEDSYKNIEDIKLGDKVITHTGDYKRVVEFGSKISKTVIVKAQGIKPTETTENHPYYIRKMKRVWNNKRRCDERVFGEPEWVKAGELKKGDFLGININKKSENTLSLSEEECYILGRYIADGHTRKDCRVSENRKNDRYWQVILSIGSKKLEDFRSRISENNYSVYKHTKNVHRVVFSNKRLVEIAEKYCGIGAINKKIPQVFINLPKKLLEKVIDGYMDGDGSSRNGEYRATSISEELILTLSQAVAKVFRANSGYSYTKRPSTCMIEGRTVNQNDTYTITFRKEMKKQSIAEVIGDVIWLPFKERTDTGREEQVFNMEVEDDNSYTANNAIVHNCQGFSMAGKLKGSSTACGIDVTTLSQYTHLKRENFEFSGQSYLFWEFVRLQKEINPKYFMLENVRITKKWLPMFNDAMGVEPTRINSSLVSAQNRDRYYWHNLGHIEQPEDKGIILRDILEDKLEVVGRLVNRRINEYGKRDDYNLDIKPRTRLESRKDNKSGCLTTVTKDNVAVIGKSVKPSVAKNIAEQHEDITASEKDFFQMKCTSGFQDNKIGLKKTPCLRAGNSATYVLVRPCKPREFKEESVCHHATTATDIKGNESIKRVYADSGKAPTVTTMQGGNREPKVLINESASKNDKAYCITARYSGAVAWNSCERKQRTMIPVEKSEEDNPNVYNGIMYRKLTPLECERLQTMPDNYTLVLDENGKQLVSNSQRYKMIGNGWTIDVPVHILKNIR